MVLNNTDPSSCENCSCDFLDTAQYRVSALNIKGEVSSVATIVVKSKLFLISFLASPSFPPARGHCLE